MAAKKNYRAITTKRDISGELDRTNGVIVRDGELDDIRIEDLLNEVEDGRKVSILITLEDEEKDI